MRDRLVELQHEAWVEWQQSATDVDFEEYCADNLIANGVTLLPCKIGDSIYRCGDPIKKVYEWEIVQIQMYFHEIVFIDDSDNYFTEADIGKTVFLTREEAEAALQKGGAE